VGELCSPLWNRKEELPDSSRGGRGEGKGGAGALLHHTVFSFCSHRNKLGTSKANHFNSLTLFLYPQG